MHLRGKPVQTRPVASRLDHRTVYTFEEDPRVVLTLGTDKQAERLHLRGIHFYKRHRLVEAYKCLGMMLQNSDIGACSPRDPQKQHSLLSSPLLSAFLPSYPRLLPSSSLLSSPRPWAFCGSWCNLIWGSGGKRRPRDRRRAGAQAEPVRCRRQEVSAHHTPADLWSLCKLPRHLGN